MYEKKIEIDIKEAKNIVDAIEGLFDLGFTGDGLPEIKEKLKRAIEELEI
jgi:hypothetical protein